jgi:hypothetical protein
MFARANINFTGKLAAPAGFPLVLWPFTFRDADSDAPMDLTGMFVVFRLYLPNGNPMLALQPGTGLTVVAAEGRVFGTSQGIAHAPIAAGTHRWDLTVYEADAEPLRQVYGIWEFVTIPALPSSGSSSD